MTEKRYQFLLSEELLEKAAAELNEPKENAERWKAIDELKNSFDAAKYGPLLCSDDAFLLQFLRAKKFDLKKALNVLHNYHSIRREYKEVFEKVSNYAVLQPIAEKGIVAMLDGYAYDGSAVMLSRNGFIDGDVDVYALMAYSVLFVEKVLEEERNQICGISSIRDLKDFSILIYTKVSPIAMAKMSRVWQDAMPIRFKAAHVINEGTIYDVMMTLFKPFIKKKMLDRIRVHGSNYSAIHEYVDPKALPPYLGGTGPDPDQLAKKWLEKVTEDWPQDTAL